jgi:phasin family protein
VKSLAVLFQRLSAGGTAAERLAQQIDMAKAASKTALSSFRELGRMIQKTGDDVVAVISTRIIDSFDDLSSGIWPKAAAKR